MRTIKQYNWRLEGISLNMVTWWVKHETHTYIYMQFIYTLLYNQIGQITRVTRNQTHQTHQAARKLVVWAPAFLLVAMVLPDKE